MNFKKFYLNEQKEISAGLLAYKMINGEPHVFLAKPAGPYWKNKDNGAWDIPKGLIERGENLEKAAKREFEEEIGMKPTIKKLIPLGKNSRPHKDIYIWAFEGNPKFVRSNTFEMEWPPGSGKQQTFPEIETAKFFDIDTARKKVMKHHLGFLSRLVKEL